MEKRIQYDNINFVLGSLGRYYFGKINGVHTSLHRYKYQKEKGPIPEGWHIHHKDGNCFNNDVENLEPIDPASHSRLHIPSKETLDKWQKAGIKKAADWHSSPEGLGWHNEHYEKIKEKLHAKIVRACSNCGSEVITQRKQVNVFCKNACKSMWRRNNKPDKIIKPCEKCGTRFETRKYLPARFCSKACKPAPNPLGYHSRFKDPTPIVNVTENIQQTIAVIEAKNIINDNLHTNDL